MGKVAQSSVKYVIEAELESSGMVEKPDIVGAIFGQTEGLLGEELDLRELQEKGRVGRIDVKVDNNEGRSRAEIDIPTSLDATETALLGASLETIDRVGPTNADIKVKAIKDQRNSKRDYIVKRAKQLLQDIEKEKPGRNKIAEEIREEVRTSEITEYRGFEAGPEAETSREVILVEGRADLINLLRNGVKNTVAIGGTSIPDNIVGIMEEKDATAFLDGDRGGDLILKELKERKSLEYVARAPENKEVEELGKEQIYKALRDKEPVKFVDTDVEKEDNSEDRRKIAESLDQLIGTRAVSALDEEFETVEKFPLSRFEEKISGLESCHVLAFDGEVSRDIVERAEEKADYIAGMKKTGYVSSSEADILTREELKPVNVNK